MIAVIFPCFSSFRKYSGINKTRCYRDLSKVPHHVYAVITSFGITKNKLIKINQTLRTREFWYQCDPKWLDREWYLEQFEIP